jgi:hypothetical protein
MRDRYEHLIFEARRQLRASSALRSPEICLKIQTSVAANLVLGPASPMSAKIATARSS